METKPTYCNQLVNRYSRGKRVAGLMALALAMPAVAQVSLADGYSGHASSIAQKEITRRQGLIQESDKALLEGRKAFADKDFEEAVKQYQLALTLLPSGSALADRRRSYTGHLGDGSLALAQKYSRVGKYDEARSLLEGVLANDPGNLAVIKRLEYLDDPIRTNPSLTYEHTQNVEKVRQGLYKGEGFYNLGQYDEANDAFNKVLLIDKYNTAARRWLERVAYEKSRYALSARDHTRAELLKQVDLAWEIAAPAEVPSNIGSPSLDSGSSSGVELIQDKLNNIIIPSVNISDETLESALDVLKLRARELDTSPEGSRGINFIIRNPSAASSDEGAQPEDLRSKRVASLELTNVPLGTVLQYICDATGTRFTLDEHTVTILSRSDDATGDLYSRTFVVPPDFIPKLSVNAGGGSNEADDVFGSNTSATGGDTIAARRPAKELLEAVGVKFEHGAFANYIPATNQLVVSNTLGNIDLIESIIDAIVGQGPRQVKVTTKFIEINQENTDELGFDWVLNDIGTGNTFNLDGGSIGNGNDLVSADFANSVPFDNGGIVTAGNRTGTFAIAGDSLDSIINNPDRLEIGNTAAPGILSLTGVFSDTQVQSILRGLAQKKGTDIMTAPSVTARSGEKATINIIREFIYPTEYEPPELPNDVGSSSTTSVTGASVSSFPVTPATPTAFETKNVGVSLEIDPTIGENNYTIDLSFVPEIVEFEGFVNYGSPISTAATDALGNATSVVITENRIEQPVFSKRAVNTSLTIYDGYTVAVGGLMREDVQDVEDKVPILGDLPLIGRLFQSKSENHVKSNLIIFVTAEIIDAAGARINQPGPATSVSTGGVLPPLPGS